MIDTAPVLIFCYKRLDNLVRVIEALKQAKLSERTDVYLFSDGFKGLQDRDDVLAVRNYISQLKGFQSIKVIQRPQNLGLAENIITGVSSVIAHAGRVIVLEDDLLVSDNFLSFMNCALEWYKNEPSVFSISGYTPKINYKGKSDTYFTYRSSSWGWATWKEQWETVDWEMSQLESLSIKERFATFKVGSDFLGMLRKQRQGRIDSWAVRWCFQQFLDEKITVYPVLSKINNIGVGDVRATHTVGDDRRFDTPLDNTGKTDFQFRAVASGIDSGLLGQFKSYSSIPARLKSKIRQFSKDLRFLGGKE